MEQFLSRVDLLHPVPARGFDSCQLWWMGVDEHWVMGAETNRKENKLGGNGLSFLCTPTLALKLTDSRSLNQQETEAMRRRWNTSMLV